MQSFDEIAKQPRKSQNKLNKQGMKTVIFSCMKLKPKSSGRLYKAQNLKQIK